MPTCCTGQTRHGKRRQCILAALRHHNGVRFSDVHAVQDARRTSSIWVRSSLQAYAIRSFSLRSSDFDDVCLRFSRRVIAALFVRVISGLFISVIFDRKEANACPGWRGLCNATRRFFALKPAQCWSRVWGKGHGCGSVQKPHWAKWQRSATDGGALPRQALALT